jgi:hypothetical protein
MKSYQLERFSNLDDSRFLPTSPTPLSCVHAQITTLGVNVPRHQTKGGVSPVHSLFMYLSDFPTQISLLVMIWLKKLLKVINKYHSSMINAFSDITVELFYVWS